MPITSSQREACDRLQADPSLTDNLHDHVAAALLAWAETQVLEGHDTARVARALKAANADGVGTAEAALDRARRALLDGQNHTSSQAFSAPANHSPLRVTRPFWGRVSLWTRRLWHVIRSKRKDRS